MFLENHFKLKCKEMCSCLLGPQASIPNVHKVSQHINSAYNLGKASVPVWISAETACMMFLNAS